MTQMPATMSPDFTVHVPEPEMARLLGMPMTEPITRPTADLVAEARQWYAEHGQPWFCCRLIDIEQIYHDSVRLADGRMLKGKTLANRMDTAGVHALVVMAASAGPQVSDRASDLWAMNRPDLAFVLDGLGSGVTEQLTVACGAKLCEWADPQGMMVLPHYSPGYTGWPLHDQATLLRLLASGDEPMPGPLRVLPSQMLVPTKSTLAVFGITRKVDLVERLGDLVPCRTCGLEGCNYRRTAYESRPLRPIAAAQPIAPIDQVRSRDEPAYSFPVRALERWKKHLVNLKEQSDGRVEARFQFNGNICNGTLVFTCHYDVALRPAAEGLVIERATCWPAPGSTGHQSMCEYLCDGDGLMYAIGAEQPLVGQTLDEAVNWSPPTNPAACLCTRESRDHKWKIVFQVIHYTLAHRNE